MKKILLDKAFEAMDNAYAPYSNYHVGACVKTKDGQYFMGANIENASFGAFAGLLRGGVVDLLEHARDRDQERRVDLGQALDDLRRVGLVGHGDALVEAGHLEDAGQHVGQREEDQGAAVGDERVLQALLDGDDDTTEAAVHDLAALGVAGGAGGVDDRAGVLVARRERGLLDLLVGDAGAGLGELGYQVVLRARRRRR